MIELSHPLHGQKVAYLEAEAVADEKNGWVRTKEAQQARMVENHLAAPAATEIVNSRRDGLAAQYEVKFGKKPHHRMSDKTIAEKLK